jgi:hypothetical protein
MILPANIIDDRPLPFLAKLFGKRWIAFADKQLVCGITFLGETWLTHNIHSDKYFELPKGYSLKNFIPQK